MISKRNQQNRSNWLTPSDRAYVESLPGFKHAKVVPGINAYDAICVACHKPVKAGTGVRVTVRGPFSRVHKVWHHECVPGAADETVSVPA
jgi:hypothetical protein